MKWAILSIALVACATVSARESQADTYRMRVNQITDKLTPLRERVARLCHSEGLPDKVYEWCGTVEDAFDVIADSQRVAWAAVDAYEVGTLAGQSVENAIGAIESAVLRLEQLGSQPSEPPPP